MAVGTTYSALYDSDGNPKDGRPLRIADGGAWVDFLSDTIPTTMQDDVGDVRYLIPVATGKRPLLIVVDSTDMDSNGAPTLNADLVLRTTDKDGNHTDTVIYDSSAEAAFTAAIDNRIHFVNVVVPNSKDTNGHIVWKVVAAAATAVQGTLNLFVLGR